MILIEMPIVFAALSFVVGFYFFLLDLKDKLLGRKVSNLPYFGLMLFGILFGFAWLLIIKYTFLEGVFLRCPDINFFCN